MQDDDPIEGWNRKAEEWRTQVGREGDANRRLNSDPVLWRLLGPVAGLTVLDAGCGTGYLSRKLAQAGARVIAVDAAARMIEIARQDGDPALEIDFRLASCADLTGIEDRSVDRIVSNYVLMDLPELDACLRAFHRVLKPGGEAVLVFSHPCFPLGDGSDPDAEGAVTFTWRAPYFEEKEVKEPAWKHFTSDFLWYHRPLSRYWRAFRAAGFQVEDFEEPVLTQEARHDLEEEQVRRYLMRPGSVAFRLAAEPGGDSA